MMWRLCGVAFLSGAALCVPHALPAQQPASALVAGPGLPEAANYNALARRILSPGWTPALRFSTADKPPSACKGVSAEIDMTIAPANSLGQYHGTEFFNPGNIKAGLFLPVRYRGESFNCLPNGQGIITYSDGSAWIGAVASPSKNIGDKVAKLAQDRLPLRAGLGLVRTVEVQETPVRLAEWNLAVIASQIDRQFRLREVLGKVVAIQTSPNSPVIRPIGKDFDHAAGNGRVRYHFADGARLAATFQKWVLQRDEMSSTRNTVYQMANGNTVRGKLAEIKPEGPLFARIRGIGIVNPTEYLPAGSYQIRWSAEAAAQARKDRENRTDTLRFDPRDLISSKNRALFVPSISLEPEMLQRAGTNRWGCSPISPLPEGWIVWWPSCATAADNDPAGVRTEAYSPDGKQVIARYFSNNPSYFYEDAVVKVESRGLAVSPVLTPVDVQHSVIGSEVGEIRYRGPFTSMRPDGDGFCWDESLKDYTEPCTFRYGKRIDDIHLARVDAKKAQAELAAAKKAADEELRRANEQAAAARRAAEQQAYAAAESERRAREAAEDEEDSGNSAAYFADMLNDLRGKAQQSAAEMDAVRRQVAAQNAAQQRMADARAAANAARQQQAAAERQANAQAANSAAAERAREAQRAAAERQRAAQARLAEAQAAATRAQSAARPSPSAGSSTSTTTAMATQGSAARTPAAAVPPSILTFRSATGWQVGQTSQTLTAQGLSIRISVAASTIAGKHYYRAEFCSNGASGWNGGMRLTDSYPTRTHATIRVPAGGCTRWSEHLSASATNIYVLVQQDRGS